MPKVTLQFFYDILKLFYLHVHGLEQTTLTLSCCVPNILHLQFGGHGTKLQGIIGVPEEPAPAHVFYPGNLADTPQHGQ